jgi:hypothetical protein
VPESPRRFQPVRVDDVPWRPSTIVTGVFLKDIARTDGWEM